ncbi:PAS domain-containing protein, partial [Streptomyces sp. TRM76130]|nr:PAS domain-containing protein [Streptomyces sp. TRM76130]
MLALTLRGRPLLAGDGSPGGYVVTVEQPDEGAYALTGKAFQQSSLPMSVHDVAQRYLGANDAALHTLGATEDELIGRRLADTLADVDADSPDFHRYLRQVAETGRPARYETCTPALSPLGEHAWRMEMWPVRDASGAVTAVSVAAFETTEQHRARQRLALLNEAAAGIGTTLDVVRTAEELIELLVPRMADFAGVDLLDWVLGSDEPVVESATDLSLLRVAHRS